MTHRRPTRLTRNVVSLLTLVSCVFLDQATKCLVVQSLPVGSRVPVVGPVVLTHVRNQGAAFGLFQGSSLKLAVLGLGLLLVVILWWRFEPHAQRARWGLVLVVSGSIGNSIDRVARGSVVDFVDVGFWPVFNVADSLLVIGACMLSWTVLTSVRQAGESAEVSGNKSQ